MKPYLRLAYILVLIGAGLLMFERFGLEELRTLAGPDSVHFDDTIMTLMIVVPVLFVIAGCLVFIVGKMRRL